MNLGQLRTAVLEAFGGDSSSVPVEGGLTATVVNNALNASLRAITAERSWSWLDAEETINTVAGTDSYTPSATWGKTRALHHPNYGPLRLMVLTELLTEFESTSPTGRPRAYTEEGGQLVLRPVPDAVYALSHFFRRVEPGLSGDSDVPLMPAQFHDVIVAHAVWRLAGQRHQTREHRERALQAKADYEQWTRRMRDEDLRTLQPRGITIRPGAVW